MTDKDKRILRLLRFGMKPKEVAEQLKVEGFTGIGLRSVTDDLDKIKKEHKSRTLFQLAHKTRNLKL